jgi:hypothetical protein
MRVGDAIRASVRSNPGERGSLREIQHLTVLAKDIPLTPPSQRVAKLVAARKRGDGEKRLSQHMRARPQSHALSRISMASIEWPRSRERRCARGAADMNLLDDSAVGGSGARTVHSTTP